MAYDVQVIPTSSDIYMVIDYRTGRMHHVSVMHTAQGIKAYAGYYGMKNQSKTLQEAFQGLFGDCNLFGNYIVPCVPGQCAGHLNSQFKAQVLGGHVVLECLAFGKSRDRFVQLERNCSAELFWYGYSMDTKDVWSFYINTNAMLYYKVTVTRDGVIERGTKLLKFRTLEEILFSKG